MVKLLLIVLHLKILAIIVGAHGQRSRPANIASHHTATNQDFQYLQYLQM
jgi:hypothetical protein